MMAKDYSGTLRKIIRKTQFKDYDKKIQSRANVMVLDYKLIWTDGSMLAVDDPTLMRSIGGWYIVNNYLKKAPIAYDIQVRDRSLQITGENELEWICEGTKEFLRRPKSDFLPITPQEFEKLKHENIGIHSPKDFKDRLDYIQKTFSDKELKTFNAMDVFLYFFEDENVRAVLG